MADTEALKQKTSDQAVLLFLKQAALEPLWTTTYVEKALGIERPTAKQVAAELELMGYAEPVRGKRDTGRNTDSGNNEAGVRPPRLTRAKGEELLKEVADRAGEINNASGPLRIVKIIAVGGILTKHERIQDIDLLLRCEPKPGATSEKDRRALLKALRGRSPALKLRPWEPSFANLPAREVWKSQAGVRSSTAGVHPFQFRFNGAGHNGRDF